ncbi:MAG: hypothetical protein ACPGJE_02475 [Wenzhouxiangellaceae bacterium]
MEWQTRSSGIGSSGVPFGQSHRTGGVNVVAFCAAEVASVHSGQNWLTWVAITLACPRNPAKTEIRRVAFNAFIASSRWFWIEVRPRLPRQSKRRPTRMNGPLSYRFEHFTSTLSQG